MLTSLLYIHWNPNPELFRIGSLPIRYYGLLWVVGIALAYFIVRRLYRDRRLGDDKFDPLFLYCFFGILVGARLGHCLFYDPGYYLHHLWEMVLPVRFLPDGGWEWRGYEGLASHGGTLGLMLALWLYCRKTKMHYMDVLDMIAIATPVTAGCIRLANLMNSEIIGNPTTLPWGFLFERVHTLNGVPIPLEPRHPAQLYEALAYFVFFLGMIWLYRRGRKALAGQTATPRTDFSIPSGQAATGRKTQKPAAAPLPLGTWPRGFFFGLCLTEIFLFRFFIEFLKASQMSYEDSMTLNMGQWLSIPFVLIGVYCMFFYGKRKG